MTVQTNILVTGATGFVGQALLKQLLKSGAYNVTAALRADISFDLCAAYVLGDLANATNWSAALNNQKIVVHAAARAHVFKDEVANPLEEYRRANLHGTLNLARQSSVAGVKRFVFISSIKVNGEQTHNGQMFKPDDVPAPQDNYGISKYEAEQGLQAIAAETGMEIVIIRPTLVYGPNVKGNFASISKLVATGFPLPLGAIYNQRSFVGVDNLVDLIVTCIEHPAAANQVFLVGDGQDLSTTDLLSGVACAMGKPSRLFPLPPFLLMLSATLLGKKAVAQRLLGSLQVDISKARDLLGWVPPISVDEGLRRCFFDNSQRY